MPKPVILQYADGRQYEVANTQTARRAHPDADILAYADGSPHPGAPAAVKEAAAQSEKDRAAREAAAAEAFKSQQQEQQEASAAAQAAAEQSPAAVGESMPTAATKGE